MTPLSLFAALTALLQAQTNLITTVTASQPPEVSKVLWTRFMDDTKWIHDLLAFFNGRMEKLIGAAPDAVVIPAKP